MSPQSWRALFVGVLLGVAVCAITVTKVRADPTIVQPMAATTLRQATLMGVHLRMTQAAVHAQLMKAPGNVKTAGNFIFWYSPQFGKDLPGAALLVVGFALFHGQWEAHTIVYSVASDSDSEVAAVLAQLGPPTQNGSVDLGEVAGATAVSWCTTAVVYAAYPDVSHCTAPLDVSAVYSIRYSELGETQAVSLWDRTF